MPMIVITGKPSSGKTTVAKRLSDYFEKLGHVVHVISSDSDSSFMRADYGNHEKERVHRNILRSYIHRYLTRNTIVICDALNSVKGFRYELFCVAKSVETTYAVVQCVASGETCFWLNEKKDPSQRYAEEKMLCLLMRYESPTSESWDNPLFTIHIGRKEVDDESTELASKLEEDMKTTGRSHIKNESEAAEEKNGEETSKKEHKKSGEETEEYRKEEKNGEKGNNDESEGRNEEIGSREENAKNESKEENEQKGNKEGNEEKEQKEIEYKNEEKESKEENEENKKKEIEEKEIEDKKEKENELQSTGKADKDDNEWMEDAEKVNKKIKEIEGEFTEIGICRNPGCQNEVPTPSSWKECKEVQDADIPTPRHVELPFEKLRKAILEGPRLKPNLCTRIVKLPKSDYLKLLNHITLEVLECFTEQQRVGYPGDTFVVPGLPPDNKVVVREFRTTSDMMRMRRRFIDFMKRNREDEVPNIISLFTDYLVTGHM